MLYSLTLTNKQTSSGLTLITLLIFCIKQYMGCGPSPEISYMWDKTLGTRNFHINLSTHLATSLLVTIWSIAVTRLGEDQMLKFILGQLTLVYARYIRYQLDHGVLDIPSTARQASCNPDHHEHL